MSARVFYPFARRPDPYAEARATLDRIAPVLARVEETSRAVDALSLRILHDDTVSGLLRALGRAKFRAELWGSRTDDPEWSHSFACAAADIGEALKAADETIAQARAIEDRLAASGWPLEGQDATSQPHGTTPSTSIEHRLDPTPRGAA